jgi:hypothetical protein
MNLTSLVSTPTLLWSLLGVSSVLNTPLTVSGRWIHDSRGANFTYAGANWPGAGEVMIPEGLQYASIADTVSKLRSIGMNAIRLTFATELVDDILDNGGDVTVQHAFINALGSTNGSAVYAKVKARNPHITDRTTRLQVYDLIAAECNRQGVYVHLDNHVSKAMWCCSGSDGNAWFADTYFNVTKWNRGLQYMVKHVSRSSYRIVIRRGNQLIQRVVVFALAKKN